MTTVNQTIEQLKTTDLTPAEMHDYLKDNYTEKVHLYISDFGHYIEVDKEDLLFNIENSNFPHKYQFIWSLYSNKIFIRFEKK